ncbi:hypothetical protein [Gilvimarinus algae]|uniref:Uncharacterized protein n=1 Tax=Gilvimarinus algae TaxID=3058037 RepID=A0ABT8TGX9_9GAMM|nr:hypothetical protein [Gilvimarinus sp. SDUM040014]MDO3381941.1 hypothetical protein [Gilvimarinus sp. SDUM040014]
MRKAVSQFHDHSAKHSVKHRVERDIAALNRKIVHLENEPRCNDQLLAAYRMMLETRTEVLECLTRSLSHEEHRPH